MNSSSGIHVIFGANGGLGQALVRQLVEQGKPVRAVTRSGQAAAPPGVELAQADVLDPAAALRASEGADVLYHAINVPYDRWPDLLPPIMDNLIAAAASTNARLVYGDNLYMYGEVDGPLHEGLPYRPAGKKGQLRADLADGLIAAHEQGKIQAVLARSSDYVGPGATNTITSLQVIGPILKGKKAMWIGSLDAPHTISYVDDVARGLILLSEHDRALGQVWHIPASEPLTGRRFIEMVCEHAGVQSCDHGVYSRTIMRLVGIFSPMVREVLENLYQFERSFVLDVTKFAQAFGPFQTTPNPEAIATTIAWYRSRQR
ncbi:MAG TPA: NAD-dependent epimerase/dehydratase family protein [Anaerolineales bacterium]